MGKRFSLSTFWDEIRSYKATHTNVLGSIFALLSRQPPKEDDANNTLKVMNAVPWLPEFEEFEKRFELKLVTMFGLTESGIVTHGDDGLLVAMSPQDGCEHIDRMWDEYLNTADFFREPASLTATS